MSPSPDLVNCLYHHTRQREQAIGIDFDSQLTFALYGCLGDLTQQEAAKQAFAAELKSQIDMMQNRMKQIMSMVQAVKNKRPLLDEAMTIQGKAELAAQMLEQLNGR